MFKDKVKVTVVALVMVLLMVLSITTDLFVGLADVFRAKAEEATPTDATPVTRDVTVYKELNDSDKDRNLAGAVIKVFKDSACTESITEFVLSYDGKSYGGDDRVVYKSLEERANANASKAIAKLQEDTYYYQLDKKLFRSNDDYSKTGYDYNNIVGSFSIVAGDGVQEIKLDNNMFRPTEKVATSTDASSEVSTEVTTETTTESDTQVATTSDASSEETETTTQVATPTDSIPEVKPVATLASVFRMAKAAKAAFANNVWVNGSFGAGYGNYHIVASEYTDGPSGTNGDMGTRVFCVQKDKYGPCSSNTGKGGVLYSKENIGSEPTEIVMKKVLAYYYDELPKNGTTLKETEHYLSLLYSNSGETPSWAKAAKEHPLYTAAQAKISFTVDSTAAETKSYSSISFRNETYTNVFVSKRFIVTTSATKQYCTLTVPKGVTLWIRRASDNSTVTGKADTTVTLYKGDTVRLVTSKSKHGSETTLSGTGHYGEWSFCYYIPNDIRYVGFQKLLTGSRTQPTVSLSVTWPAYDPINIEIDKVDSIREDGTQVGKTSLAGAIFKMEYFKGKTTASGAPTNTWYIKTVKNGSHYRAAFSKTCLVTGNKNYPSDAAPETVSNTGIYELEDGAMRITEVKAPSGYKVVDGKNKGFFKVKQTKVTGSSITVRVTGGRTIYAGAEITADAFKQYEQKERYDFRLKKVDSYGNPMAGVAFLVTASNGDQHVVVTDKNGEFDSSKLGYTNVNGNDATLAKAIADTTLYPTYKETNVFFTTPGSGKTAAAEIKEETVGTTAPRPLYKDTYTVREIHRQYVTIDGKKYKLTQVYDLGPAQKITVSDSAKNGAVIDFGTYTNTAIPKMTSSAISTDTNTKISVAGKNASFKDSIKATNLKASTKYTLMSVAVDANTGKAYKDADGKYVAKNVEFTTGAVKKGTVFPETTASVTFTGVNTSNVKSRKLVFYEYLVEGSVTKTVSLDSAGKPVEPANCVAKDASVSNKAQTVNVISLETKVLVDSTKTNVAPADEKVDVTDTVTLHNLVAGTKFTLVGKVSDGENIKVENEVEFTAKGDDETVSVPLKGLNLTEYAGKSLYVICELKYDGEVIATHNEDGTDPDEKFYVPAVETNAIDATTNTQYSITFSR